MDSQTGPTKERGGWVEAAPSTAALFSFRAPAKFVQDFGFGPIGLLRLICKRSPTSAPLEQSDGTIVVGQRFVVLGLETVPVSEVGHGPYAGRLTLEGLLKTVPGPFAGGASFER